MKTNRLQILLTDSQKTKAKRASTKLFGKSNVSAFIAMLIEKYDENLR